MTGITFLGRGDTKKARRQPWHDPDRGCWVVPLTQGYEALIDEEDVSRVGEYSWSVLSHRKTHYAQANVRQRRIGLHRFILGDAAPAIVDHINGNGLDCRRENLRAATPAQSQANRGKEKRNTSGFKGVTASQTAGKWVAQIQVEGKNVYLGTFHRLGEAAVAYDCAARRYYGEFARLNFPLEGPWTT